MDTVQMTLRGVPVEVADALRAQAKASGKSLNRYMVDRLSREAERLTYQRKLVEKYRLADVTQVEVDETRRLRDAMKGDWD